MLHRSPLPSDKAATKGTGIGKQPGMLSFTDRAKWQSWKCFLDHHSSMGEAELKTKAEAEYIKLFKELFEEASANEKK